MLEVLAPEASRISHMANGAPRRACIVFMILRCTLIVASDVATLRGLLIFWLDFVVVVIFEGGQS